MGSAIIQNSGVRYIKALNAFRGFAALYVVLYHLRYYTDFDWFGTFPILQFGYIGVDFFFILSGLIISHVYLKPEAQRPAGYWSKFITYRLARLFPVHALIMVLMLICAPVAIYLDPSRAALTGADMIDWVSLTFLVRQWALPEAYAWNSPAWSVSAEFFAYVIAFPIITYLCAKRLTLRTGLIMMVSAVSLFAIMLAQRGTVNITDTTGPLIRVVAGFLLGSGIFVSLNALRPAKDFDTILGISLAGLPIAFVGAIALKSNRLIGFDALLLLALTATITLTYLSRGPISRWLSQSRLFWLGEISFALYMCHIPVLRVCKFVTNKVGIERGFVIGLLGVALCVITAHLLYTYVEIPCRRYIRELYTRRAQISAQQAAQ